MKAHRSRFRVVSWNMHAAFDRRANTHDRAWHYLRALDPDVALVQEAVPPKWASSYWNVVHATAYPTSAWGSAVVTKTAYPAWEVDLAEEERHLRRYRGAVMVADMSVDMQPIRVASVHAAARQVPEDELVGLDRAEVTYGGHPSVWPLYLIFDDLFRGLTSGNFIIGGDLNAARSMDDVSTMVGGSRDFFQAVQQKGFMDCLLKFSDAEIQTYFNPHSRPYQLDHLFCDSATHDRLQSCGVDSHPVGALKLSDHAPIVADFDL